SRDWSSDVCSSDLHHIEVGIGPHKERLGSDAILRFLIECTQLNVADSLVDQTNPIIVPGFEFRITNRYAIRIKADAHNLLTVAVGAGIPVTEHGIEIGHISIGYIDIIPYQLCLISVDVLNVENLLA